MSKQPKALELAAEVSCVETRGKWDAQTCHQAAALLRTQHQQIKELGEALNDLIAQYQGNKPGLFGEATDAMKKARMALLKAKEQQ